MNYLSLLLILVICLTIMPPLSSQPRSSIELQNGWKFKKGSHENAHTKQFDDSSWDNLSIPHDWAIGGPFTIDGDGNTGKLPWKGEGWYRKNFKTAPASKGKTFYLIFDGIMAFPKIYVNGKLAGKWDYGYNSFYLDITEFIHFDQANLLAIHVDTKPHGSRWYPGAGIYRKIQLVSVEPIHIDVWGTWITTPIIKPNYTDIKIHSKVINKSSKPQDVRIVQSIFNHKNIKLVSKENKIIVPRNRFYDNEALLTLTNPRRWDINDPYQYSVLTEIYSGSTLLDSTRTQFGIRTIQFTADDGFYLNDRRVQLKGVNLHHDLGPLGAAFNEVAMRRQLKIMQDMGCNAIRTSHNTAAPELLDLCDEMGLLVFNEVFDKYDAKAGIVDTTDFESFTQRNIRNFVLRDRNHPSLFLWSVGNEIGDVQWDINNGFHRLQTMLNYLRKYDSTRPVTLVCDNQESAKLRHFDYYDIHCWNYGRRYALARQMEPNKSVIISESASTLSTRGFYEFPLPEKKTDFTRSLQVSSYDLNAPYWAEIADDDFMWQIDEPYIAGEFVWTGFDYLGEPTPYNNQWTNENGMSDKEASRSSYFGIVDLCGIPKDRYYLYKSYWKPEETTIHILPHWNWEERLGKNVPVFVYTNGDCAELFLNGVSQGKKCKDPKSERSVDRFRLMWNDVIYEPGELKVIANKENEIIGEKIMKTAGKPYKLKVTADKQVLISNGKDLSFVLIEAVDEKGVACPLAKDRVHLSLEGPGKISGVGNGNPQSFNSFQADYVDLFYGKAMIIVGSSNQIGQLNLKLSSKQLGNPIISFQVE